MPETWLVCMVLQAVGMAQRPALDVQEMLTAHCQPSFLITARCDACLTWNATLCGILGHDFRSDQNMGNIPSLKFPKLPLIFFFNREWLVSCIGGLQTKFKMYLLKKLMLYYGWKERGKGKSSQRQKEATGLRLEHRPPGKSQPLRMQPLCTCRCTIQKDERK